MIGRYPPIWRHRGGVLPNHALGYMSSLFIVRVRTLRLGNGWVIAIFSNVLPKVQRSRSISPDSAAKWRQGTKVTLAPDAPFPYYWWLPNFIKIFSQSFTKFLDALKLLKFSMDFSKTSLILFIIFKKYIKLYQKINKFTLILKNCFDIKIIFK